MTLKALKRRNTLVEQHLPLVRTLASIIAGRIPPSWERDDLYQAGVVGLITAAERWDPRRGVKFAHYAGQRVRGAMWDLIRGRHYTEAMNPAIMTFDSFEALPFGLGGRPTRLIPLTEAITPCFEDEVIARIDRERELKRASAAIALLPAREKAVIVQHYLDEQSLRSMTRKMGVCKQRVSQIHQAAMEAVRGTLATAA